MAGRVEGGADAAPPEPAQRAAARSEPGQPVAATPSPREAPLQGESVERTGAEAPQRREAEEAPRTDRSAEIVRQVRMRLEPGLRSAVVHLSPPELGRVSIRLRMSKERLTAVVRAESAETLQVLERHLPELRATLAQQGIEAGEFDLGLGFGSGDHDSGPDTGAPRARYGTEPPAPEAALFGGPRALLEQAAAVAAGVDVYA